MIDEQPINLQEITQITIDFLDNGAGKDILQKKCDWCKGKKDPLSSDHPSKAIVSMLDKQHLKMPMVIMSAVSFVWFR